jgi:3-methyladenine DNA glycosylase AlkD
MPIINIQTELKKIANPTQARLLAGFFKTGPGQYGAGDKFLGIKVPQTRAVAKKFVHLGFVDLQNLLNSPYHEFRLAALLVLVQKYNLADKSEQKRIFNFYLKNSKNVNNWDLVDLSADRIMGPYLEDKERSLLYKLVKSKNLWERRIAVLTTFWFIKNNDFADSLRLARILLDDQHDLIHKAVGWMLREIGKRNVALLEVFLKKYYQVMPRTMLRYAIERFPEKVRQRYLKGLI